MERLYSKRKTVSDVRQVQLQWMQVLHAKEQLQEGLCMMPPSLKCTISACADACTDVPCTVLGSLSWVLL